MNSNNNTLLVIILIVAFTNLGYSFGKKPKWIEQLPDNPELLQGVGVASETGDAEKDRNRADEEAISEIIHQISTSVSSELVDFYKEEQSGETSILTTNTSSLTKQYAKATVKGIKIIERYHDKKLNAYYSYAVLSRVELEEQFRESAEKIKKMAQDYHIFAQQALIKKDIYTALSNYSKALSELLIVQANIKKRIECDLEKNGKFEMLQVRLENELSTILSKIQFKIVSGNAQKAERGRNLKEQLVGTVLYYDKDIEYPIRNLPVLLEFVNAKGELTKDVISNLNGTFKANVNLIESAEAETGIIKAMINFSELDAFRNEVPTLFARLEQCSARFTFKIAVAASVKMFVHIFEESNSEVLKKSMTTRNLIKRLVKKNFSVIDARRLPENISIDDVEMAIEYGDDKSITDQLKDVVDYAIVGTLISESGDVSSGVLYYAKADADVRVIDLKTGRILASSAQNQVEGLGDNYPKAHKNALENCSELVVEDIVNGLQAALK